MYALTIFIQFLQKGSKKPKTLNSIKVYCGYK